jgi:hypothetical protein
MAAARANSAPNDIAFLEFHGLMPIAMIKQAHARNWVGAKAGQSNVHPNKPPEQNDRRQERRNTEDSIPLMQSRLFSLGRDSGEDSWSG